MFFVFLFSTYFPSESSQEINTLSSQLSVTGGNYYLNQCHISYFEISGSGGPVYFVSSSVCHLVIENSKFMNCISSGKGGAIRFDCPSYGGCAFDKVCASNCSATGTDLDNGGQFSYSNTGSSKINYYIMTSHSYCAISSSFYNSLSAHNGNQLFININSSNNNAVYCAGLYCFLETTCEVSFSTFYNNQAYAINIGFRYCPAHNIMKWSNVVKSSSPGGYAVIYSGSAVTSIFNTTFTDNAGLLFIVVTSGSLTVDKCWIAHSGDIGGVNFISTKSYLSSHAITHQFNGLCNIEKSLVLQQSDRKTLGQTFFLVFLSHYLV